MFIVLVYSAVISRWYRMKSYEVVGVQLWGLEVNSNWTRPMIYIPVSHAAARFLGQSKSGVRIFTSQRTFENSRRTSAQKVGRASPSHSKLNDLQNYANDYTWLIQDRMHNCEWPRVEPSFFSDLDDVEINSECRAINHELRSRFYSA